DRLSRRRVVGPRLDEVAEHDTGERVEPAPGRLDANGNELTELQCLIELEVQLLSTRVHVIELAEPQPLRTFEGDRADRSLADVSDEPAPGPVAPHVEHVALRDDDVLVATCTPKKDCARHGV